MGSPRVRWSLAVAVGAAALASTLAPSLTGVAHAAPTADPNAVGSVACPGATSGRADGAAPTGSPLACPQTVSASGTVTVGGSISYSPCGNVLQRSCSTATLTLTAPDGSSKASVTLAEPATPAFSTDDGSSSATVSVSTLANPNGTWHAVFSGDAAGQVAFVLDTPPATPGAVTASSPSAGTVHLTWPASSTPDTSSYQVYDGTGGSPFATPSAATACSSGTCSLTLSDVTAGSHSYSVTAVRPANDGKGGSSSPSAHSAPGSVTVAAPSTTDPSTPPTGGSTTGAGTGSGSGSGTVTAGGGVAAGGASGTTSTSTTTTTSSSNSAAQAAAVAAAAAAQHRAQTFESFAPAAGIAQLPPLPSFPTPATNGTGEPTDPGTYVPTLPYDGQQTITEKVSKPTLLGHVTGAASDREVLESIAAAALVLLLAAHVRVYARRDPAYDL